MEIDKTKVLYSLWPEADQLQQGGNSAICNFLVKLSLP
ncbi:MAG: hypothetical protein ACI8WM_000207 [Burkholderiaceae bacterium]|jgi:hypothetical protein